MKRLFAALGVLLLAACSVAIVPAKPSDNPAAVRVEMSSGHCSGTVISSKGLVLTAGHCGNIGEDVTVVMRNGRMYKGKFIKDDDKHDVALISIDSTDVFVYAALRCDQPTWAGEPVYTIGHPETFRWVYAPGDVMGMIDSADAGWGEVILLNMRVWHGNSGGGLFDKNGMIVGVVNAYFRGALYGVAVKVEHACELVKNG